MYKYISYTDIYTFSVGKITDGDGDFDQYNYYSGGKYPFGY